MLIYEKKVDGERQLWGSTTNVPTENDVHLQYVKTDGTPIAVALTDSFIDGGDGTIKVLDKPNTGDKTRVDVWMGNKSVIPQGLEKEVQTGCKLEQLKIKTTKLVSADIGAGGADYANAKALAVEVTAGPVIELKTSAIISREAKMYTVVKVEGVETATEVFWHQKPYPVDFTNPVYIKIVAEDTTHVGYYKITVTAAQ